MTIGWAVSCDNQDGRREFCDDGMTRLEFIHELRADGWYVDDATLVTLCPSCTRVEEANKDLGPIDPIGPRG